MPPPSLAVLDAALTWTCGALQLARTADPELATPCAEWDLRLLLTHMDDSLAALGEAARVGHVDVRPPADDGSCAPLVARVSRRATATRAAWGARVTSAPVRIAELNLGRDTLALVGAVEVLVHGWDVARTVDGPFTLPEDLAAKLLPVARVLVGERSHRFAPALSAPESATNGELLLAHLGRDPTWTPALPRSA